MDQRVVLLVAVFEEETMTNNIVADNVRHLNSEQEHGSRPSPLPVI